MENIHFSQFPCSVFAFWSTDETRKMFEDVGFCEIVMDILLLADIL